MCPGKFSHFMCPFLLTRTTKKVSHSPLRSPSPSRTPSRPRRAAAQTCCCHTYTVRDAGVGGEGKQKSALYNNYTFWVINKKTLLCFQVSCDRGSWKYFKFSLSFYNFCGCRDLHDRSAEKAAVNRSNLAVYFAPTESPLELLDYIWLN